MIEKPIRKTSINTRFNTKTLKEIKRCITL